MMTRQMHADDALAWLDARLVETRDALLKALPLELVREAIEVEPDRPGFRTFVPGRLRDTQGRDLHVGVQEDLEEALSPDRLPDDRVAAPGHTDQVAATGLRFVADAPPGDVPLGVDVDLDVGADLERNGRLNGNVAALHDHSSASGDDRDGGATPRDCSQAANLPAPTDEEDRC